MKPGVRVTIAGSLINFLFGIVYAWSVLADGLIKELSWSKKEAALPFSVFVLVFSTTMVIGGRLQDRVGPRIAATLGGVLGGLGFTLCAMNARPISLIVCFGILFGCGAAFRYPALIATAIKWFPPNRRGFITGIVVMSFGAGTLVWPPVLYPLILYTGVLTTFLSCGIFLLLSSTLLAQFISVPQNPDHTIRSDAQKRASFLSTSKGMMSQSAFITLWLMMGLSIGTGHMLTAHLVQLSETNYQLVWGHWLVSVFALCNTTGRLGGGVIADRIGYMRALRAIFTLLAFCMILYLTTSGWQGVVTATVLLGFGVGSLFSVFPVAVADIFALEDFGLCYGLLYTGVGLGGGLGPFLAGFVADLTGTYNPALVIGLSACITALGLSYGLERTFPVADRLKTVKWNRKET